MVARSPLGCSGAAGDGVTVFIEDSGPARTESMQNFVADKFWSANPFCKRRRLLSVLIQLS